MTYKKYFKNKTICVTGGTGSFGNYIIKKLIPYKPKLIKIFSRDEKKQDDMRHEFKNIDNLEFIIGDIRNKSSLKYALKNTNIVYNAAALKQVPSCEYNVYEAVQTNIQGVQNLIEVAIEENVEKVISISTDKAVEPVNAMGMTKAIQERLITTANLKSNNTIFSCVRYGNVVSSRGSVIPLFYHQICSGNNITITNTEMTRFLLTLNEAIDLVFSATISAVGGEIFVLKLKSAKIIDIAEIMLENLCQNKLKYTIIGIRPGEKIHEVLISETESIRTIEKDNIFIILPQINIPNITKTYNLQEKSQKIFEYSSKNALKMTKKEIKNLLEKEGWLKKIENRYNR